MKYEKSPVVSSVWKKEQCGEAENISGWEGGESPQISLRVSEGAHEDPLMDLGLSAPSFPPVFHIFHTQNFCTKKCNFWLLYSKV